MEKKYEKRLLKAIRVADSGVNWIILIIFVFIIAFCVYAILDINSVYKEAGRSKYIGYKPLEGESRSFDELKKINGDVVSWITIYGTEIDYPVVQGQTNKKYLETDVEGKHSFSGSLFLDYRNSRDFSDFNSFIYGHHMAENAMFGDIKLFNKNEFFKKHKYGNLFYNGKNHGIQIVGIIEVSAYDNDTYRPKIVAEKEKEEYINYIFSRAIHKNNVEISGEDKLVLLSTCALEPTDGREILIGKITDKTYKDTFVNKDNNIFNKFMKNKFKILKWIIPAIFLLVFIMRRRKRKKKKEQEQNDV